MFSSQVGRAGSVRSCRRRAAHVIGAPSNRARRSRCFRDPAAVGAAPRRARSGVPSPMSWRGARWSSCRRRLPHVFVPQHHSCPARVPQLCRRSRNRLPVDGRADLSGQRRWNQYCWSPSSTALRRGARRCARCPRSPSASRWRCRRAWAARGWWSSRRRAVRSRCGPSSTARLQSSPRRRAPTPRRAARPSGTRCHRRQRRACRRGRCTGSLPPRWCRSRSRRSCRYSARTRRCRCRPAARPLEPVTGQLPHARAGALVRVVARRSRRRWSRVRRCRRKRRRYRWCSRGREPGPGRGRCSRARVLIEIVVEDAAPAYARRELPDPRDSRPRSRPRRRDRRRRRSTPQPQMPASTLSGSALHSSTQSAVSSPSLSISGMPHPQSPASIFCGSSGQSSAQSGVPSPSPSVSLTPQPQTAGASFCGSLGQASKQIG